MDDGPRDFPPVEAYEVIYAFTIPDRPHAGRIKIGDTRLESDLTADRLPPMSKPLNAAANKRINEYTGTAGVKYTLLYTELAVRQVRDHEDGSIRLKTFHDREVHRVLENSGIHAERIDNTTGTEWFQVDLGTVKKAIKAVKSGTKNLAGTDEEAETPIVFRPEQEDAIKRTIRQFRKSKRMLWNAKMRFGKTLSALEVVKKMGLGRTIIITHRPVVDDGWYEDFGKIFHKGDGYRYGSKSHGYTLGALLGGTEKFVWFASIQDLRGSTAVGGKFDKNQDVFSTVWDLVIVDEAHEGTKTTLGDSTVRAVLKPDGPTKLLALSGTPFNILAEYEEAETYTWDYVMEQEAKSTWDKEHFGDPNPYEDLPQLCIYTYDLGEVFRNEHYVALDDKAFNFAEFFRIGDDGRFAHEPDVRSFLNLLCKSDPSSNYPFSREQYRSLFRHTLWMVPGVGVAKALKSLMLEHPVFGSGQFDIVNVAGRGDEESDNALEYVQDAIRQADGSGTYTITLSCGRLTTGVTVKEWTAVLMLAGTYSTSAANYLQTIFRVQSPCNDGGKVKERAYVFDFAPDRTLKMVAKAVSVSARAGHTSEGDRDALGKFLNFCPVIGISGSRMERYDTGKLLRQLKRAWADAVVRNGFEDDNLYNQELLNLTKGDLSDFDELKKIVGATKPSKTPQDIPINDQGLTDEEREKIKQAEKKPKRELSAEEKALLEKMRRAKENRKAAISILTGISVRMPLLIYGADVPYDEDIDLKRFVDLVDNRSWTEFMPKGVTKKVFRRFEKYYDEDVFVAAGRRIRNVTRYADTLPPTERVREIAHLFGYFKNPDKETVLTPWRVVNMHMSGTLGGWDFWNDDHTEELNEGPRFVDRGDVTKRAFGQDSSRVLEINSKTGLYPLYVTYSMFRERLGRNPDGLALEFQRDAWNDVVRRRMFVVCKTPMAKAITRRTLIGYSSMHVNMHHFVDLDNVMANKRQQFMRKVTRGSYWDNQFGGTVEFSAIVGNPPYQRDDGGHNNSAMPVYQNFVETAINLNPEYVSMITPSRWFSGGRGLDDYRDRMLRDRHMRELVDFPKLYEPFQNVKIRGGISYFLWDRSWDGPCTVQTMEDGRPVGNAVSRYLDDFDILVRANNAIPILKKVKAKGEPTLDAMVSSTKPFGLRTYFHGSDTPDGLENPVKLYGSQNVSWIDRDAITTNADWIDSWKVLVTAVQGTSAAIETKFLSVPIIAGPDTACTETYLVAGLFKDKREACYYATYLKTRFVRFLISLRKSSQHVTKDTFKFVPRLSYDHSWNDEMLYKRYSLSNKEISFVESTVKPME